jgi:hypothetical protein
MDEQAMQTDNRRIFHQSLSVRTNQTPSENAESLFCIEFDQITGNDPCNNPFARCSASCHKERFNGLFPEILIRRH